jgi:antitoxin StbD
MIMVKLAYVLNLVLKRVKTMTLARILTENTETVSNFRKGPSKVLRKANGEPVAIMKGNRADFYAVPAALFERMMDQFEDRMLGDLVNKRLAEGYDPVPYSEND